MTIPNQESRTQYHILIGKDKYGDYIFLDEAFEHSDNFKGLCGTRMQFHTEDEYEEAKQRMIDDGWLKELWVEAVKADRTELGLEEWSQDVIDEGYSPYDDSYRYKYWIDDALEIIDEHEYEETGLHVTSEFSDCTGGGRMFEDEMLKRDYWERVDEKNFKLFKKLYNEYEK